MTDFSVEMTELSSVQLCIWRKRKMTVPSWRGKGTQEACDLRVGILGTDREVKWEVSDRLTRVTWPQKKKKKSTLNLLLSRLKQNLMATNHFCFHKIQGPASEVWMASSSHGDQCTPHNLSILQHWGRHSWEHVPTANPLCERGGRVKQREALLEAGIWIRNREAGVMQTVVRELLIKRTSSKINTVCCISVKNKTITNAIIFFHVSLVK